MSHSEIKRINLLVSSQSLVGFNLSNNPPPYENGNYFTVMHRERALAIKESHGGKVGAAWHELCSLEMRVLNMWVENFNALPDLGITDGLDVIVFHEDDENYTKDDSGMFLFVNDERVPDAYKIHGKDGLCLHHGYRRRSPSLVAEIEQVTGLKIKG